MALLHVASQLRSLGIRWVAAGVDHGLRAAASAELDQAQAFAAQLGMEFERCEIKVRPGGNLQARARDERYAALSAIALRRNLDFVATAHHADDRAETVVMRLLSGASPSGLAVLPPRDGYRIRPMIFALKADVLRHLERHQVPFANDPSNHDPRFLRARVRSEVMPLLKALSPAVVTHLSALAAEVSRTSSPGPDAQLPEIIDEGGQVVRLGRAQREQLLRALRYRQLETRVLLSADRAIVLDPQTGQPRLLSLDPRRPPPSSNRHSSKSSSGDAKKRQSG
jgi:tRNA(Ile)-lysidine synthase